MAGQHIEREARYEKTRMSPAKRDEMILALYRRGVSEAKIAARVGLSTGGTHYAIRRLTGRARVQVKWVTCESCWDEHLPEELDRNGLCVECR
jgi:hypothetical protein